MVAPHPRLSLSAYRATERRRTTPPELRFKLRRIANVADYIECNAPFPRTEREFKARFASVKELHDRLKHAVSRAYEATADERLKPFADEFSRELRWADVYRHDARAIAWSVGCAARELLEVAEQAPEVAERLRVLVTLAP